MQAQVVAPSNDEIKESNVAGFAEYKMKLGDWSLNGGLRYEAVTSDYYSFGQYQTEPSRKYHDLFPNLSVGWQKNKWGIQLSYNKRISRPSYYQLNSNTQYDNRYEYEGGNPLLRPTIKQNFELNVTYSWLNFAAGYSHNKDMRLNFGSLYQEGTEITIWTSRNFDKFESFNASLTASPKFGFYSPTLTLSYWQQNFDAQAYGLATKRNEPEWQINFRNWFTIGKTAKAMLYPSEISVNAGRATIPSPRWARMPMSIRSTSAHPSRITSTLPEVSTKVRVLVMRKRTGSKTSQL